MITTTNTYPGRRAAQEAVRAYLASYHPAGYGTTYTAVLNDDGTWTITFTRASTCG